MTPSIRSVLILLTYFLTFFTFQTATASDLNHNDKLRLEADSLIQLSKATTQQNLATHYAENALQLAKKINDPLMIARANHRSGISWRILGDYLVSEARLSAAMASYNSLHMEKQVHVMMRELSETYRAATDYQRALRLIQQAYQYFQKTRDSLELAFTMNRIAAIKFEMLYKHPDYDQFFNSIAPNATSYLNDIFKYPELSLLHTQIQAYIDSTLAISRKLGQHQLIVSTQIIQATMYFAEYRTSMAIEKYDEAIDLMLETGHIKDMPLALTHLARIYGVSRLNQPERAIELATEALNLAKENNINIYVFMASGVLYDNYLALGNYKEALKHYQTARELLLESNADLLAIRLSGQEYDFQLLQKETEIALRRKQLIRTGIAGGVFILLISFFVITLGIKNREKWKLLEELNNKNMLIRRKNKELTAVNESKDRLFSIIAHDLRSPFQAITGYSELLRDNHPEYSREDIQKFSERIHMASGQTMNLLDNLLDWARLQRDKLIFNPRQLELRLVTEKSSAICKTMAESKDIQITNKVSPGLMVFVDEDMLTTILRNLTCNAVKFTNNGGKVSISAEVKPPHVIISVTDNGIGIEIDRLHMLFGHNTAASTQGTINEKGSGLGLILCKEFVEKHCGTIWVESTPGKGSTFSFSLPIE